MVALLLFILGIALFVGSVYLLYFDRRRDDIRLFGDRYRRSRQEPPSEEPINPELQFGQDKLRDSN